MKLSWIPSEIMASFLFSLLFLLLPLLSSAVEFWNIDCGAADGYVSPINLTWVGDGDYVRSGESSRIPNATAATVPRYLATLRMFPKNKKNCYTIPAGIGKKVMVTVYFFYGNYDGRGKPPFFQLMFEGEDWIKVTPFEDPSLILKYDVIYVTKRENTSVCLGRISAADDPFISSISLRLLDPKVYAEVNSSYSLYGPKRYALAANESDAIIRFPDDPYDRMWYPATPTTMAISNHTIVRSNATRVYTSRSADEPPVKLFRNAIVAKRRARNLTIATSFLAEFFVPLYLNLYFSEISNLTGAKERRSFHIYVDGVIVSKEFGPIVPPFGNVLEFSIATLVGVKERSKLALVPTADSTLPPLLNAVEVLFLYAFANDETNPIDVVTLARLQNNFGVLQEWTGDPCLPQGYKWEWVGCSTDQTPRITKLFLASYGLSGSLPDFSDLTELATIDLHNNSLSGSIPEFLARLPNLQELNLADNKFDSIPASLSKNVRIKLNITGNSALERGQEGPSPPPREEISPKSPPNNGCIRANNVATLLINCILLVIVAM